MSHNLINLENKKSIISDLYQLPYRKDKYIIYRPTLRLVALANTKAYYELTAFLNSTKTEIDTPILEKYYNNGFFNLKNEKQIFDVNEEPIPPDAPFIPYEVTLDITWRCNLKCIYCYGRGGDKLIDMEKDCAIKAIDICLENCSRDKKTFILNFHGNGEPTQNWNLLKELVYYSKKITKKNNIPFQTSIATNGVISKEQAEWIAQNIDRISLSYDGNEHSQNLQRPTRSNVKSSQITLSTADYWKSKNKNFNIRATITKFNVNQLSEICLNLGKKYEGAVISLEPMVICGRAHDFNSYIPDSIEFAENLMKAKKAATELGINIYYSGVGNFIRRRYFCGASVPNFSIMADGSVTSCFSYSSHEPMKNLFVFGKWDTSKKDFIFYKDRIADLRKLSIENDPYCNNCFAKYHCVGDCPAIRKYRLLDNKYFVEEFDVDYTKNRRCEINRAYLKMLLIGIIENKQNIGGTNYENEFDISIGT